MTTTTNKDSGIATATYLLSAMPFIEYSKHVNSWDLLVTITAILQMKKQKCGSLNY